MTEPDAPYAPDFDAIHASADWHGLIKPWIEAQLQVEYLLMAAAAPEHVARHQGRCQMLMELVARPAGLIALEARRRENARQAGEEEEETDGPGRAGEWNDTGRWGGRTRSDR